MPFFPLLLALALASTALWPQSAQAEVRRCVTESGQTIFTDHKCAEVQAVERLARDDGESGAQLHHGTGCARSLQDLVFAMTSAIDERDANRLASVYHWPGTSADEGFRIWTRLDAIATRPLVDIVPVMPTPVPEPAMGALDTGDAASGSSATEAASEAVRMRPLEDPELYPQTAVRRDPVALRVEQTLANGSTPSSTVLRLTHYFGCWWVRF